MRKLFILTFFGLMVSFSSFALYPITGPMSTCSGSYAYLSDSMSSGGTWSSSNTAIATVGSSTGLVWGVSAGIATITYTVGSSYVTCSFTVNASPAAITGPASQCVGTTITLSDATSGGTWTSVSTSVATAGAATGVITGVSSGVATIKYTLPNGCVAYHADTVGSGPSADSITGPSSVCVGSTITLYDMTSGGTWSSSNPSVGTIGLSSGVLTGVSSGTVVITYTVGTSCGSSSANYVVTVGGTTSAGTISGPSSVMVTSTISLSESVSGGTWSSGSTSIATISSTGVVTGVATGVVTITYTKTGCGGTAYATKSVTVNAFDGISGNINFTSGSFYGMVKVWLIKYNPSTHILSAVDSAFLYCSSGTSVHYAFTGVATDSFRVKAATDSAYSTSGYVPTYHTASYYWSTANVIPHTSGTSDINKDINMISGTPSAGPGFIGGDVTTGANKGTSGGTPVANLLVIAVNSTTGAVVQQTYTNAAGNYSFTGLPYGSYLVHPELINYGTIPFSSIGLTPTHTSQTGASFIQHTVSHYISPVGTGVNTVLPSVASVVAFPNPTSGKLNIVWNETATETGTISVTDITGREVYNASISMTEGSGTKVVDLSTLNSGLYIVTVKSANVNYNNKIQVQH